jgi:uncharacterized protein YgiM (DUF1202 family)
MLIPPPPAGTAVFQSKLKMPFKHVSNRGTRLALLILATGLCATLCDCSDAAIVTAQVNLQKTAADGSEVLTIIPKGSAVKVSRCTNGWCSASWNGREGYILAKYVRIGNARSRARADGSASDGAEEIPQDSESSEGIGPSD